MTTVRQLSLPLSASEPPEFPGETPAAPGIPVAMLRLSTAARWFIAERFRSGRPLSPATRLAWETDLGELIAFLGDPRVGEIQEEDLVRFLDFLERKGRSPRSRRRAQITFRAFFRWAAARGLPRDPAGGLPLIPYLLPPYPALSPAALERLLRAVREDLAAGDPRGWWIVLLAMAGLKTEEIAELQWRDIQEMGETIELKVHARTSRHRKQVRRLRLPAALWREGMRVWAAARERLLRDRRVREKHTAGRFWPWDRARLDQILRRLARRIGIPQLTTNQLRWTSAVIAEVLGVPAERIRGVLGVSRVQWRGMAARLREAREAWQAWRARGSRLPEGWERLYALMGSGEADEEGT